MFITSTTSFVRFIFHSNPSPFPFPFPFLHLFRHLSFLPFTWNLRDLSRTLSILSLRPDGLSSTFLRQPNSPRSTPPARCRSQCYLLTLFKACRDIFGSARQILFGNFQRLHLSIIFVQPHRRQYGSVVLTDEPINKLVLKRVLEGDG